MKMFELSPEGARKFADALFEHLRMGLLRFPLLGEHSITCLSKLFQQLDGEADYNLSKRKSKRDRERWAVDEAGRLGRACGQVVCQHAL